MPGGPSPALRRRAAAVLLRPVALLCIAVLTTGCGFGEPRTAPPSGIDGLVVPTPSPEPSDFVSGVDNPWFPLAPGSEWTYAAPDGGTVVTTVSGTTRAAGVEATVVDTVARDERGRVEGESTAWYAQDRDGNVWHLGDDGVWEAGQAGAEAGLVMPATPRVGDGFAQEKAPGIAEDERRVLSIDEQRTTSYDAFDALVQVEDSSPLHPGVTRETFFARGVGPVLVEGQDGDLALVELTSG
ncbi:hypothetical protein [Nocardioides sp. P5_C9_2]